jgi:hypothetical protein
MNNDLELSDEWSAGYARGFAEGKGAADIAWRAAVAKEHARVARAVEIIRSLLGVIEGGQMDWGTTWPAMDAPRAAANTFLAEWDAEQHLPKEKEKP